MTPTSDENLPNFKRNDVAVECGGEADLQTNEGRADAPQIECLVGQQRASDALLLDCSLLHDHLARRPASTTCTFCLRSQDQYEETSQLCKLIRALLRGVKQPSITQTDGSGVVLAAHYKIRSNAKVAYSCGMCKQRPQDTGCSRQKGSSPHDSKGEEGGNERGCHAKQCEQHRNWRHISLQGQLKLVLRALLETDRQKSENVT